LLSHLQNLTWLTLISRGPKMEITNTRIVQGPGHTRSAKSCAVPCLAGKPGMYQQSSFLVITFTLLSHGPWTSSFVCSDATIRRSHQQSNCNDGPIHHGLSYYPFTVEFTRNEAKDCPYSSCVVRSFASVSGYYDSSFH
jgi:hypothetical protein